MADTADAARDHSTPATRSGGSGFLRNAWYVAAWSDDLVAGQLLGRKILNEGVVFYRKADGGVAALEDRCAHRYAPLHIGKLVGDDRVQCAYHGLEFAPDGSCSTNPHGNKRVPSRATIKSYMAVEKHKAIWIWMGDAAADPAKIPDFSVMDNVPELHATKRDRITIKAGYELIIDNLLDLSHTSYLHDGILGNADTVESDITVEEDGMDVIISRHASKAKAPGMFALQMPDCPPLVDKFTHMRWMAPATMRLASGICEPDQPHMSGCGYHAIHMLTPETDKTTHYHFTAVRFGVRTTDEPLNRQIQEKIAAMRRFAFEEQDAPVIEAQQRIIDDRGGEFDPIILAIDVGPVRYKRILQKLITEERRG